MRKLETLTIQNFKSIRKQKLQLNMLNVFIGSNGSGKSNLIEVFRFLREIVNQNLAGYTAKKGGRLLTLCRDYRTEPPMLTMNVGPCLNASPSVSVRCEIG